MQSLNAVISKNKYGKQAKWFIYVHQKGEKIKLIKKQDWSALLHSIFASSRHFPLSGVKVQNNFEANFFRCFYLGWAWPHYRLLHFSRPCLHGSCSVDVISLPPPEMGTVVVLEKKPFWKIRETPIWKRWANMKMETL